MPFQYEPYENRSLGAILDLMTRGDRARADAMRQGGAARARAAEIGGENAANLGRTLGQIASGVGQQIGQHYADAPRREMEQLQLQTARDERSAAEAEKVISARLTALFSREKPPTPQELYSAVGPERGIKIVTALSALQTENQKRYASTQELLKDVLAGMDAIPEDVRASVYQPIRQNLIERQIITEQDAPPEYNSQWFQQARNFGKEAPKPDSGFTLGPGQQRFGPDGKPIASVAAAPPKPPDTGSFEDYVLRKYGDTPTPEQIVQARKDYQQADDRPFRPVVPVIIQGPDGAYSVDRTTNTATAVTGPDGKPLGFAPTAEERNQEKARGRLQPLLDSVVELTDRINTNQGVYAKLAGGAAKLAAKANLDDDVAEYEAMVQAFTPLWARALGHTGVLTQQDVDSARVALPRPGDSRSLKDRKIARINKIMGSGSAPSADPPPADAGRGAGGAAGPKIGERRIIDGKLGEWDGKGWKPVR